LNALFVKPFHRYFPNDFKCKWLAVCGLSKREYPAKKPQHFDQGNGIGHKIPENYATKVVIKFDKIHRFARLFYGPATI
jgi:hypothetical protein